MIDQEYYELPHLHKYWTNKLGVDNEHINYLLTSGELPCSILLTDFQTIALIERYTSCDSCGLL